jgi:hypothetical protein
MNVTRAAFAVLLWVTLCQASAAAQTPVTTIEADALLSGRPTEGVLVLHGGHGNAELVDADALVFMGASSDGSDADVLTVTVGVREPHGLGRVRVGRFVLSTGAVRPVHLDGVLALGRTPGGTTLEAFGGLPVAPELGERDFDWLAGARLAHWAWGERLGAGVSYVQRRDAGQLDDEELGADLHASPLPWLDLTLLGAWDLVHQGPSEARVSAAVHDERTLLQLFALQRVPARLLPGTSLFSVVSDAPRSELGGDMWWNAFPRLDLGATLAVEALDDALGYRSGARAALRFSDEPGAVGGDVSVEATRRRLAGQGWTGGVVRTRWPLGPRLSTHLSVELVAPDAPAGRGALWPWARAGARYAVSDAWSLAAAVGAKASPEHVHEVEALVRVSYAAALEAR